MRRHDWGAARECSNAKDQLRQRIESQVATAEELARLRPVAFAITQSEQENLRWLEGELRLTQQRLQEAQGTTEVLRRLRGSYGGTPVGHWQAYS